MNKTVLFIGLLLVGLASADERILSYHSDIYVRIDGQIEVTETIAVRAEGQQIRRGIYRDYPTDYKDRFGNDVEVLYEPRSVLRNGRDEAFHTEKYLNGIRTYFGSSDRTLEAGEHTYTYRYDAGRMLGFFDTKDELYWNVTGNGWAFPIDNATASVTFEFDVAAGSLELDAYQGGYGSTQRGMGEASGEVASANFRATKPLLVGQGLTISVAWPKGLVAEPTDLQRFIWLLSDNLNLLIALGGLATILAYYIPVWKGYGKDPAPGVILTRYEPPEGFSAASLRYINNMGYDNEVMSAGIVSLAVKGYLRIKNDDGDHSLRRQDPGNNSQVLAPGEQALYDALFRKGSRVTLVDENHERISGARKAHERSLKRDYHKRYFRTNGALNLPALIIAVISSLVALRVGPGVLVFVIIGLMAVTIIRFAIVMKRPTGLGRRVMDQAAGFGEYLEIAEKDEMNLRNPPEKTPQLFEKYLPFALALGVDQQWAERFTRIFATLKGPNDTSWHPTWYNGSWNHLNLSVNTSRLSSGLSSAISSSVTPPGSSSGGGGGGFSGGGGGGGGGGGW